MTQRGSLAREIKRVEIPCIKNKAMLFVVSTSVSSVPLISVLPQDLLIYSIPKNLFLWYLLKKDSPIFKTPFILGFSHEF